MPWHMGRHVVPWHPHALPICVPSLLLLLLLLLWLLLTLLLLP